MVALAAGLAAAATGAAPAGAARPSATSAEQPPVPHLAWATCYRGFQCARARVPLDYDQPLGPTISLALIRLPATDPAHKIGSIFINPGGPGGSGVDFVRFAGPYLFSDQVRARFDLVGFDPRGVRRSSPLRCFDTLKQLNATMAPFFFPVTARQQRVWVRSDREFAHACARRAAPIMDHMATADVARDLDLLRRAVGDDQLSYYGGSYGSYLGETYASLFPSHIRALAIDGVIDPVALATGRHGQSRWLPWTTREKFDQGAAVTLAQFFMLCKRGGPNCAFSAGSPRRRFARLAARLRRHPARLPKKGGGTRRFTYADLVGLALDSMRSTYYWPSFAATLEKLDSPTQARAAASDIEALRRRLGFGQHYPNYPEGYYGVSCTDSENPRHVSAWVRAAAAADQAHSLFGPPWTWASSTCQPWPGKDDDRYLGPFNRRTSNPVLVIGNRFDPATPYQGAVRTAGLLPRSRLLTLDGWGHTSLFLSACIDRYLATYLLRLRLPAPHPVCQPDVVPFAQPSAGVPRTGDALGTRVIPATLRWMIDGA